MLNVGGRSAIVMSMSRRRRAAAALRQLSNHRRPVLGWWPDKSGIAGRSLHCFQMQLSGWLERLFPRPRTTGNRLQCLLDLKASVGSTPQTSNCTRKSDSEPLQLKLHSAPHQTNQVFADQSPLNFAKMYATRALRMMPTKRMMRLPVSISLDSRSMTLLIVYIEGGSERYVETSISAIAFGEISKSIS